MESLFTLSLLPFIVLAFIVSANLILAFLALRSNPRSHTVHSFVLMVVVMLFWGVVFFFESEVLDKELSQMLVYADFVLGGLISVVFINFAFNFPYPLDDNQLEKIKNLLSLVGILVSLSVFSNLVIEGFEYTEDGVNVITGIGFVYYGMIVILLLVLGLGWLIRRYFDEIGYRKQQIKYVFWGFAGSALIAVLASLVLPRLFNEGIFVTTVPRLGIYGTSLFLIFTTYAIVKHRLMDIRLAIRAGIVKIINIIMLSAVSFLVGQLFVQNYIDTSTVNLSIAIILLASFVVIFYGPLDRFVRIFSDAVLFQREYNRSELLKDLGKVVSQSIDLIELEGQITTTLKKTLRIEVVKFVLKNQYPGALWEQVQTEPVMVVYDELVREIEEYPVGIQREHKEKVLEQMREAEIAVTLPLISSKGVIGMLLLGEKKGGDAYTSFDLEALETLMYQAGVAIENASLFAETQHFNVRLQEEVNQATHNLELRNKRLSVLRKLDEIVLNTFDMNEMSQKIVDLVSWEMGFNGALMVLVEGEGDDRKLRATALSGTPLFNKVLKMLPNKLQDYTLPWGVDPSNLFYRSIIERKPFETLDMSELYSPPLNKSVVRAIQQITKTKHALIYPITTRSSVLGAVAFDVSKSIKELSHDEHELVESFINEVGIAIENIRLYKELEDRNEKLSYVNFRLKELDQMKDELVSVASHELRTPMTIIKSYLWMAMDKYGKDMNPDLSKYIERAFESSERMINLVNDMLSASRLEGKRIELSLQPYNLRDQINEVVSGLKTKADEKGLGLRFIEPDGDIPNALVDKERMFEILTNLIGNSVKYTQLGEVVVSLQVESKKSPTDSGLEEGSTETEGEKRYLWVLVKDTGFGISQEDMPRLFKKFGRLDAGSFSKIAEAGGTGLGLYITKGLVELHGGEIWVESEVGKGSTFAFSVRVA